MPEEPLSTRFYKALFTLADDMRDRAGERQEFSSSWQITVQQLRLLRTVERLTRTKYPEGIMLKSLAESLNVTSAAASGMVETLVKRNYLERDQAKNDRRSVRIKLSKYCIERIRVLDLYFQSVSEKIAAQLPEEDLKTLVQNIEKLSADFESIVPPEHNNN